MDIFITNGNTKIKEKKIKVYETSDGKVFQRDKYDEAMSHQEDIDRKEAMEEFKSISIEIFSKNDKDLKFIKRIDEIFDLESDFDTKRDLLYYVSDYLIENITKVFLADPCKFEEFFMLMKSYHSRIK